MSAARVILAFVRRDFLAERSYRLSFALGALATLANLGVFYFIGKLFGGAMAAPNTLALLTTTFAEPKARIRVLALFSGMSSAGFAIGLIVGGLSLFFLELRRR